MKKTICKQCGEIIISTTPTILVEKDFPVTICSCHLKDVNKDVIMVSDEINQELDILEE